MGRRDHNDDFVDLGVGSGMGKVASIIVEDYADAPRGAVEPVSVAMRDINIADDKETESIDPFDRFVVALHRSPVFDVAGVRFALRPCGGRAHDERRDRAKEFVHSLHRCNECARRVELFHGDVGPEGPLMLHGLCEMDAGAVDGVYELRGMLEADAAERAADSTEGDGDGATVVLITASTYPPFEHGMDKSVDPPVPFKHLSIVPTSVTAEEPAERFQALEHYMAQMDVRLQKLCCPEAQAAVSVMAEEQLRLDRPGHYEGVLDWVRVVQAYCAERGGECVGFTGLGAADKARVRVFAIMRGRIGGEGRRKIHLDFHQSDNVVDFVPIALTQSRDELRRAMDDRSDPSTYMVSQLNRRRNAEGVTSALNVGLSWSTADDLDLHLRTPRGGIVYYGNKTSPCGCRLDFDANVSKGEAEPCENISCVPGGPYQILVDNYTRRTFGKPVHFTIVISALGKPDVVIEGHYPADRQTKKPLLVATHTFEPSDLDQIAPAGMSDRSAARARANDDDWNDKFGEPTATVSTLDDFNGLPAKNAKVGMYTLAHVVSLIESSKGSISVSVSPRDFAPGYFVTIRTKTDGVRKAGTTPSPCHFADKTKFPVKPVCGETGNARMDQSWLPDISATGLPHARVPVRAIVIVEGMPPFIALEGARLPPSGVGGDFPLASGFHVTDLSADQHVHRERWGYLNAQRPADPTGGGEGLVGAFLTSPKAVFTIGGISHTVNTR